MQKCSAGSCCGRQSVSAKSFLCSDHALSGEVGAAMFKHIACASTCALQLCQCKPLSAYAEMQCGVFFWKTFRQCKVLVCTDHAASGEALAAHVQAHCLCFNISFVSASRILHVRNAVRGLVWKSCRQEVQESFVCSNHALLGEALAAHVQAHRLCFNMSAHLCHCKSHPACAEWSAGSSLEVVQT